MRDKQGFWPNTSSQAINVRGAFVNKRSVLNAFEADMKNSVETELFPRATGQCQWNILAIPKNVTTEDRTVYGYDEAVYQSGTYEWTTKFEYKDTNKITFYRPYTLLPDQGVQKELCKHTAILVCFIFVKEIATENPYRDTAARKSAQDVVCHVQLTSSPAGNLVAPRLPIRNSLVVCPTEFDPFLFYNHCTFDSPLASYPYFFARATPMYVGCLSDLLIHKDWPHRHEIVLKVSMLATRLFMKNLFVDSGFCLNTIVYWFDVNREIQLTHFTSREAPSCNIGDATKAFWETLACALQEACDEQVSEHCVNAIPNLRSKLDLQNDTLKRLLNFIEAAQDPVFHSGEYVKLFEEFLKDALSKQFMKP
ncbi:hypothetical protein CYMTET_55195 [Cymbomonas tetramitiformis]|uniref:Uncharacterized protein n=1 Tax=Cymbomonas tetramitiformis TaxID=36881 RepID=A0AAE0BEN4_9CHLO|nr:hypothetical protein CYMTET_55195 [Cymbomonas tetramitiformis]